jgi:hypothetical protein
MRCFARTASVPARGACRAAALAVFAVLPAATAQTFGEADPLFRSNEVLELRIAAPLDTLMKERPEEDELPGEATWTAADGASVTVRVDLRTRGNYRRQADVCPFAPVRLDFRKSEVRETLFDGQDKLKLVTHCKSKSKRSAQFLLREYAAYRMFNALTDLSFRVRLLRVTWENTEKAGVVFEAPAFLIESEERLAHRVGLPYAAIPSAVTGTLDPAYTNLSSLFQYFIGNTDYSPIAGPRGKDCCHNSTLFGTRDEALFPVPYDFDMSGIVNADYATPNPKFHLRDVQSRLYRGRCPFNGQVAGTIAAFNEHRDALYAVLESVDGLSNASRRDMSRFMDKFYDTTGDPDEVRERITDQCVP